ncbi:MAG: phosphate signaling complex protein PhoU [Clostridia bacterium]
MREKFAAQLKELHDSLTQMAGLCEESINLAMKAFIDGVLEDAEKAMELEKEIDMKERDIETLCYSLLLKQQPVASDLRIVSSALKMITDLERIGDQAEDIADLVAHTSIRITSPHIKQMAVEASKMVSDAVASFVNNDLEGARKVISHDDVIDNLFNVAKSEIVEQIKTANENAEEVADLLIIIKYLERIGDHATNVAEWVVFSVTGEYKAL